MSSGGPRPGAGRPRSRDPVQPLTLRLPVTLVEHAREQARHLDISVAEVYRRALRGQISLIAGGHETRSVTLSLRSAQRRHLEQFATRWGVSVTQAALAALTARQLIGTLTYTYDEAEGVSDDLLLVIGGSDAVREILRGAASDRLEDLEAALRAALCTPGEAPP